MNEIELRSNMGRVLSFEYWSDISGWTYEEDIITECLIKVSVNFRNLEII